MRVFLSKAVGRVADAVGVGRVLSLKRHLLLFALVIALPAVGFSAYLLSRFAAAERVQFEQRLLQTMEDLADDIDRDLEGMIVTLKTLATSRALRAGDYADFYEQTREALGDRDLRIALLTPDLVQIINTLVPYGAPLPTPNDQVTPRRAVETREPQVSDYVIGSVAKQPTLNVSVPVIRDGAVKYVLLMAFSPDRLFSILQGQRLSPGWITGVTDRSGVIIARSDAHRQFLGTPLPSDLLDRSRTAKGVFEATNVQGVRILRAVTRVKASDWMVAATVEMPIVTASSRSTWLLLALGGTALLLLAGILAAVYGDALAAATESLATSARDLGRGHMVVPQKTFLAETNAVADELAAASHYREVAEDALRQAEERVRMSLEAARMGYWEFDLAQNRVFWSPEMLRLFAAPDFHGDPALARSFVHPDDLPRLTASFDKAIATKSAFEEEFRIKRGDGEERWIANVGRCSYGPDGEPASMRGVALDITERKVAEMANARFAAIVHNSGEAILGLTTDGIITAWNPAAQRLFGFTAEEAIGRPVAIIAGDEKRGEQAGVLAGVASGRRIENFEATRYAKDGRAIPVIITAAPVHTDGRVTGVTSILADNSVRKQAQERQALLLSELQHRTKNMLSVVQAIVTRSLSGETDVAAARAALLGRLQALARAYGALGSDQQRPLLLGELVDAEMAPFASRHTADGPPVPLEPQAAQTFALLIHELATNAAKYGALSDAHGKVAITWGLQRAEEVMLRFQWTERDGPMIEPPNRKGFGRTILEQLVVQEFKGQASVRYDGEGLTYALVAPLSAIQKDHAVAGGLAA